jgi:hypothetical protein
MYTFTQGLHVRQTKAKIHVKGTGPRAYVLISQELHMTVDTLHALGHVGMFAKQFSVMLRDFRKYSPLWQALYYTAF